MRVENWIICNWFHLRLDSEIIIWRVGAFGLQQCLSPFKNSYFLFEVWSQTSDKRQLCQWLIQVSIVVFIDEIILRQRQRDDAFDGLRISVMPDHKYLLSSFKIIIAKTQRLAPSATPLLIFNLFYYVKNSLFSFWWRLNLPACSFFFSIIRRKMQIWSFCLKRNIKFQLN